MRQTGQIRNYEFIDAVHFLNFVFSLHPVSKRYKISRNKIYPPQSILTVIWYTTTGSSGRTFPWHNALIIQPLLVRKNRGAGVLANLLSKLIKFV
jgi:hypothetical protein